MILNLLEAFTALYLLSLSRKACWAVDLSMMLNAFDDQYIGCTRQMEREMPNILAQEKGYRQFAIMWFLAEQRWVKIKQYNVFPRDFKDEYGIALILYTQESPFPIYQQLNRNMSIGGRSREHYMNRFHFKALHFYLTRAIQVLGGSAGCDGTSQVYRGSWMTYRNVSPDIRFGQFASSSLNRKTAQRFGTTSQFTIFSCFGVNIEIFSDFKEEEVLIPGTEKFQVIKKSDNSYVLKSSGQHCSYYNCAYLGAAHSQTFPYMQQHILRHYPSCSSTFSDIILHGAAHSQTFRYMQQHILRHYPSWSSTFSDISLHIADHSQTFSFPAAAHSQTFPYMQQHILRHYPSCSSTFSDIILHGAAHSQTFRYMQQHILRHYPSWSSTFSDISLHVAAHSQTLSFMEQHILRHFLHAAAHSQTFPYM
ncbi:ecto-ADP-ribosyltransferase 5-like [Rhinoderma darwinii]|uniref:ecto-ADP-ribosyltransferase 5-like n=1 Tax=Rhinoderma darwinii TaxID=43563 RepID=UPI003F675021